LAIFFWPDLTILIWKGFHYFSYIKYPLSIFEVDCMVVLCLAQNLTLWKIRKKM